MPYTELDVSRDPASLRALKQSVGDVVTPVAVVGDHLVVGHDPERLGRLLEELGRGPR